VEPYANNPIETDHGRLKARTRPMRGLKRLRSAQVVCMDSSRTCAVDTTNSVSIPSPAAGSKRVSPNSPFSSKQRPQRGGPSFLPTQQRRRACKTISALRPGSYPVRRPQDWISVNVVPQRPGSFTSTSASLRSRSSSPAPTNESNRASRAVAN